MTLDVQKENDKQNMDNLDENSAEGQEYKILNYVHASTSRKYYTIFNAYFY